jgi:hypothetical protein
MTTPARVDELLDGASLARVELYEKAARAQAIIQGLRRGTRELAELLDALENGLAGHDEYGPPGELASALMEIRETPALRRSRKVEPLHPKEAVA